MTVVGEFEHIWPYVNGRNDPCVRCGKPYGPHAGPCVVIIAIRRDQETGALPKPTTETPLHGDGSGA